MKTLTLALLILLCGCVPDYAGRYLRDNPDAPPDIVDCIRHERIKTGMTEQQVIASWGYPWKMDKTHYEGLNIGTWIYRSAWDRYGNNAHYVHFTNGRVSGWTN